MKKKPIDKWKQEVDASKAHVVDEIIGNYKKE